MKLANATNLNRKSGVASWSDLLSLCPTPHLTAADKSHHAPLVILPAPACRGTHGSGSHAGP